MQNLFLLFAVRIFYTIQSTIQQHTVVSQKSLTDCPTILPKTTLLKSHVNLVSQVLEVIQGFKNQIDRQLAFNVQFQEAVAILFYTMICLIKINSHIFFVIFIVVIEHRLNLINTEKRQTDRQTERKRERKERECVCVCVCVCVCLQNLQFPAHHF